MSVAPFDRRPELHTAVEREDRRRYHADFAPPSGPERNASHQRP